ncbi:two component system sensor histidine kinase PieS [Listeria sp. PSOL-1]|uniref:two component system sensor histidine kinase PieS n=1 Tax=Listeria sp. PSOL-1 TaxID=1844999 RepID=UPI0013D6F87A|nr:two component system sensor histidine kinase PieS [Listeria sp. PSOL-1]
MNALKFKYIYQLFLTQFVILFIACLMIGLSVSHFLKDYFFEEQVAILTKYGNTISNNIKYSPGNQAMAVLNSYQHVLDVSGARYTIMNSKNEIFYPRMSHPLPPNFKISRDDMDKLKAGKTVTIKVDARFNQEMSVVYVPIMNNDTFLGSIILNAPISGTEKVIGTINQYMLYTILLSIAVALALSALISKLQVNRINKLREATKHVIRGDYKTSLKENTIDEIGELASDFNKMTENLAQSHEEIVRQEKRRRQFIADVSHEMRTPLTTISGLTEGLVNHAIPASETNRAIHLIDTEAKRLTKLVNENLDYERILANKIVLHKTRFNVHAFFDLLAEQLKPLAQEKNNQFIMEIPADLEVYADYDRLTQVVMNIIKNSIQFTENGKITLKGVQDYKETILEIQDTGIGMNTEELEQIWERFYKADMSRTNTALGESGIGLSIVKQLVENHGGTITAESTPNKGSLFSIRLPFYQEQDL